MQQRTRTRYDIQLPVVYSWTDERGTSHQAGGFTRDISTEGVYVVASQRPPNGAVLWLEATLPPLEQAAEPLPLRAKGCVRRVDARGFALSSDFGLWRETELADSGPSANPVTVAN